MELAGMLDTDRVILARKSAGKHCKIFRLAVYTLALSSDEQTCLWAYHVEYFTLCKVEYKIKYSMKSLRLQ